MKIRIAVMLTCVLAMIAGPYAAAQGYPAKPVRMLVAFPAGGSADIVARVLAQKLRSRSARISSLIIGPVPAAILHSRRSPKRMPTAIRFSIVRRASSSTRACIAK